MPKLEEDRPVDELPVGLRVYDFHGVEGIVPSQVEDDIMADCPFCDKPKKMGINQKTSVFNCFVCGTKGNEHSFVRRIWELGYSLTKSQSKRYDALVNDSGFSSAQSAIDWGVTINPLNNEYCLPGYNIEGKITGLYRWCSIKTEEGKWAKRLLPSPGLGHHMFGVNLYDDAKPIVALCEGWRSAIRFHEVLRDLSVKGAPTLTDVNVLAVPGANSFKKEWSKWFEGKEVWLMYDNDHPKLNPKTGKEILVGGPAGIVRVASILRSVEVPPASILYQSWGASPPDRFNHKIPSKYDVRDHLNA